jgi:hypothetical protein
VANQIEVHLNTGKTVRYDGVPADVGLAKRNENGLVLLKEWGTNHTFYLNPESIVLMIDHGAPENAGTHTGKTTGRR